MWLIAKKIKETPQKNYQNLPVTDYFGKSKMTIKNSIAHLYTSGNQLQKVPLHSQLGGGGKEYQIPKNISKRNVKLLERKL